MIIERLFDFLLGLMERLGAVVSAAVMRLIPSPPGWIVDAVQGVASVMASVWAFAAPAASWVDLRLLALAVPFIFAVWAGVFAYQGIRMAVSLFTGGGGAL